MRIGLLTDVHYCSKEILLGGTRRPQLALERVVQAVDAFKAAGVELIVCLGDLINIDDTREHNERNLIRAGEALRSAGIPCVSLMGNHDCEVFTREEFTTLSGLCTAPLTLIFGDVALHFLDANVDWEGVAYVPDHVDWTKCLLPESEMERIRAAVMDREHKHFYFVHQNLDSSVEERHIIRNADVARQLMAQGRTAAVFQGHYHPGKASVIDGISYVTLAALCSWEEADVRIVDTDDYNA